jgi:hypothetical protein
MHAQAGMPLRQGHANGTRGCAQSCLGVRRTGRRSRAGTVTERHVPATGQCLTLARDNQRAACKSASQARQLICKLIGVVVDGEIFFETGGVALFARDQIVVPRRQCVPLVACDNSVAVRLHGYARGLHRKHEQRCKRRKPADKWAKRGHGIKPQTAAAACSR